MGWIITALVAGAGATLLTYLAQRRAAADKARADSLESAHRGDLLADEVERGIREDLEKFKKEKPGDISRW